MFRSLLIFRRSTAVRRLPVRWLSSAPSEKPSDRSVDKPSETASVSSADAKRRKYEKYEKFRKPLAGLAAIAAIAGLAYAINTEIDDRKQRRHRDIQACIIRGLTTSPYVPPPVGRNGIDELIGSAETTEKLTAFDNSQRFSILAISGPPHFRMVDAVRKHYAGRVGIVDLTECYYLSMDQLGPSIQRLAPELQLVCDTSVDVPQVRYYGWFGWLSQLRHDRNRPVSQIDRTAAFVDDTTAALKNKFAVRPIVLLKGNSTNNVDMAVKLQTVGFRVVLVTDFPVNTSMANAIGNSNYEYVVDDAVNRADKSAKAERYLLSSKSGIADQFANPADAKVIADAIGSDFNAVQHLIDGLRTDPSLTPRAWLDRQIAKAHQSWMAAIQSIPSMVSHKDSIDRLATQMKFNGDGLCQPDDSYRNNRQIVKHLAARGVLWNPDDSDYAAFATPIFIAAWMKHTAKALQTKTGFIAAWMEHNANALQTKTA